MKITCPSLKEKFKDNQWEHFCKTPPHGWNLWENPNSKANYPFKLWRVCLGSKLMFYAEIVKEVDFKLYLLWHEKELFEVYTTIYEALAKVEEEIKKCPISEITSEKNLE